MLRRLWMRPRATLLVLAAAVAAAGCQPQVSIDRSRTSVALPPTQEVEIALVADEQGHAITPDAVVGKQVFDDNCAVCHGMTGKGNGPIAPTLVEPQHDVLAALVGLFGVTVHRPNVPSAPADFTNRDLESVITPAIMFQTVTQGRAYTAMPAFGPQASFGANQAQPLTNAQRWDANVYEMMFRTSPRRSAPRKGSTRRSARCATGRMATARALGAPRWGRRSGPGRTGRDRESSPTSTTWCSGTGRTSRTRSTTATG